MYNANHLLVDTFTARCRADRVNNGASTNFFNPPVNAPYFFIHNRYHTRTVIAIPSLREVLFQHAY